MIESLTRVESQLDPCYLDWPPFVDDLIENALCHSFLLWFSTKAFNKYTPQLYIPSPDSVAATVPKIESENGQRIISASFLAINALRALKRKKGKAPTSVERAQLRRLVEFLLSADHEDRQQRDTFLNVWVEGRWFANNLNIDLNRLAKAARDERIGVLSKMQGKRQSNCYNVAEVLNSLSLDSRLREKALSFLPTDGWGK